ncbi:MAG: efflux RND transporter periplasmic adaptor subunit [Deltaproteobacteria bacterium]|nr:efflux RND transporter periplasmic adaptor subunit [Deltaproteobacteria bacterium]
MNRSKAGIVLLLFGLVIGAGAVWFYMKTPAPEIKEAAVEAKKERKLLFYRSPMNPAATSPVPMKDDMGMDFVPVYEDEAGAKEETPGTVRISPEKIQRIGVKSEEVKRRALKRTVRTVGRVEPVENKVYNINTKVSGWIEKLYVGRTDQMVTLGEPLLELYSPDLVSAEEEYLLAWKALQEIKASPYPDVKKGAEALLAASSQRLRNWDISEDQIERLKNTGAITRTMTIRAPAIGSITDKMIVQGQKIEAGEPLFKIIDHSEVWVYGEIYEYELPYIKFGQEARLSPSYAPYEVYTGRIEHIYSHLGGIRYVPESGTEIRTAKVRFELPNKEHKLKLGMYLNVEISAGMAKNDIAVPDSALIDTGTRQMVIIDKRDGTFEPREVRTGAKADDFYVILQGVEAGEWVVTSANFLIDSESNLKAALKGMDSHGRGDTKKEEYPLPAKEVPPAGHKGR